MPKGEFKQATFTHTGKIEEDGEEIRKEKEEYTDKRRGSKSKTKSEIDGKGEMKELQIMKRNQKGGENNSQGRESFRW